MLGAISIAAQVAAIALLAWVAWYDVRHYTIRNKVVITFLGLYLIAQGVLLFPHWIGDLVAGAVLFGVGFVMWLLRGLGAGDAKLMFPLGLHLGYTGLLPFSLLLLIVSTVLYVAIVIAARVAPAGRTGRWLAEMKSGGRVPYGLVLALSAVPVLILRLLWAP